MLIRTQDKLTLVNLDQVKEIRIINDNLKCEFADGTGRFVGNYSTGEKATDVLDAILYAYSEYIRCFSKDGLLERVTDIPNKVYEMPQKEEV